MPAACGNCSHTNDYRMRTGAVGHIVVVDQSGERHQLEALEGWRVMEIIRDWGLPIKAECGGACQCATCHVFVAPNWEKRIPAATEEEIDMLDTLPIIESNSRLCCQILWSDALDGLEVTLAPSTD